MLLAAWRDHGDIVRLRMNCGYRARDAKDKYDILVACGNETEFKPIESLTGPTSGTTKYFTDANIPKNTRQLKVKLSGKEMMGLCIFAMRMDVDYTQPNGGFLPVKITYTWDENGVTKTNEHIAKSNTDSYVIKCAPGTVCKSVTLEIQK